MKFKSVLPLAALLVNIHVGAVQPYAWWPLNDGSGTLALDSSGNGYNLTLNSGVTWTNNGHSGVGVNFNGATTATATLSTPFILYSNWTATLWVYPTATNSSSALVWGSSTALKLFQYQNTGKVGYTAYHVADYTFNYKASLNTWTYLTFVETNAGVALYANGTLVANNTNKLALYATALGSATDTLNAILNDVRIYNQSLTASQVTNLFLFGVTDPSLTPPTLTSLSPTSGFTPGGTVVTMIGTNFTNGDTVTFGAVSGTGVTVNNSTSITVTTPANAAGAVNVTVMNISGQSSTLTNAFTYVLPPPPVITSLLPTNGSTVGGTVVTITGTGFTNGDTIQFGTAAGIGVTVNNSTSITVTTPANAAGAVNVTVTDSSGQISTLTGAFTYVLPPPPVISSLSPTNGSTVGGTVVAITGTGFTNGDTIQFGAAAGIGVTVNNSTSITVTTPAHTAGAVNVGVMDSSGQSFSLSGAFTYVLPPPPVISSLSPTNGFTVGGTVVTITGTSFTNGDTIQFGTAAGTGVTVNNPTSITVTTPTNTAGAVNVTVTDSSGQSSTLTGAFTYVVPPTMGVPTIVVTNVPAFGTYGAGVYLSGYVTNANFATNCLLVYDFWPNQNPSPSYDAKLSPYGWFTKPTASSPKTTINPDGTWSCNMPSGSFDQYADEYAVLLVPTNYSPSTLSGAGGLITTALSNKMEAIVYVDRPDTYRRQINWSGYGWWVKTAGNDGNEFLGATGPGPNYFSDSTTNVWVDAQGNLHLRVTKWSGDGNWYCAQIYSDESFGYGMYRCTVATTNLANFDTNVIFSMFTWSDNGDYVNREINMEVSYWGGTVGANNEDYAVSPYNNGQTIRLALPGTTTNSTHSFTWNGTTNVQFETLNGCYSPSPLPANVLHTSTITAQPIPVEGGENVLMIMWLYKGSAPAMGQPVEAVLSSFQFDPWPFQSSAQSAHISQPQVLSNGNVQFTVQGTSQEHYMILSTTNLASWPANGPIIRAANQAGVFASYPMPPVTFQYTDTNPPSSGPNFYQVVTVP